MPRSNGSLLVLIVASKARVAAVIGVSCLLQKIQGWDAEKRESPNFIGRKLFRLRSIYSSILVSDCTRFRIEQQQYSFDTEGIFIAPLEPQLSKHMSILLGLPRTAAAHRRVGFHAIHHKLNPKYTVEVPPLWILKEPIYPDIDLTQRGSPQRLDQLRPPHQEYIAKPLPDHKGTVSPARWIKYWYRVGKSQQRFYKEGFWKAWYNKKEADQIRARIPSPETSALFGGSKAPLSESVPTITRREFQLLHRAPSDFARLLPLGFIVHVCGIFTPLIVRCVPKSLLPETCLQRDGQVKLLKSWVRRCDWLFRQLQKYWDPTSAESRAGLPQENNSFILLKLFCHAYVVQSHPLTFLHPYVPWRIRVDPKHTWSYLQICVPMGQYVNFLTLGLSSKLQKCVARYHDYNLQDTALIMREGGFGSLDPLDIYEYCVRTGVMIFYKQWATDALRRGELPSSQAMVKHMAPILDTYALYMFSQDWPRIKKEGRFCVDMMTRTTDDRIPGSIVWPVD